MPNIKSAKKRVKTSAVRTARNKAVSTNLKTQIKKANAAIENSAADKAEVVRVTVKTIDQAASKGIMHKNTASRKKSALAKRLNASA